MFAISRIRRSVSSVDALCEHSDNIDIYSVFAALHITVHNDIW